MPAGSPPSPAGNSGLNEKNFLAEWDCNRILSGQPNKLDTWKAQTEGAPMKPTFPKSNFHPQRRFPHPPMNSYRAVQLPGSGGRTLRISVITYLLILAAVAVTRPGQSDPSPASRVHNFVFFGNDRELLPHHAFLKIKRFGGAQITYSWKQLERGEDDRHLASSPDG
jgi:hypothetical protein